MPTDVEHRIREEISEDLHLPPPFRLRMLRESGRAFDHAKTIAAKEGAGTLVWVGRFDLVEFALVLEPDEPLAAARRAIYAGMNALCDTLAAHAAPTTPIHFEWPDALFVSGGLIGGGQLAWPKNANESERPDWLVFGATVRSAMNLWEPGVKPHLTALEEEGFAELGPGRVVETFARHFMVTVDTWQERGFAKIAEEYLRRLPPAEGVERSIDGAGNLLIRKIGSAAISKRKLASVLAAPSWIDPQSGEMLV
ncbi:MAG TPA: biotin/lipoate--protein ligase family protein [Xanthobacteraceae bacterium]|nr:biotin/lipoate--protein ligase family protein [Xanthobacteraceae bacterium]